MSLVCLQRTLPLGLSAHCLLYTIYTHKHSKNIRTYQPYKTHPRGNPYKTHPRGGRSDGLTEKVEVRISFILEGQSSVADMVQVLQPLKVGHSHTSSVGIEVLHKVPMNSAFKQQLNKQYTSISCAIHSVYHTAYTALVSWLRGGSKEKLCVHKPCSTGQ